MKLDFDGFRASQCRNLYIMEPGLEIYIRRSVRDGIDFDLARLEATKPGDGALTRFLDRYEPSYSFLVECIHNERLAAYLRRRGYIQWPTSREVTLYKLRA